MSGLVNQIELAAHGFRSLTQAREAQSRRPGTRAVDAWPVVRDLGDDFATRHFDGQTLPPASSMAVGVVETLLSEAIETDLRGLRELGWQAADTPSDGRMCLRLVVSDRVSDDARRIERSKRLEACTRGDGPRFVERRDECGSNSLVGFVPRIRLAWPGGGQLVEIHERIGQVLRRSVVKVSANCGEARSLGGHACCRAMPAIAPASLAQVGS